MDSLTGLPESSANDLVGTGFVKLLGGLTKEDTHRIRKNTRAALALGHAYSLAVGLLKPEKKSLL